MTAFASILCAVDFSTLAPRVLRHAAGFAGALGARLTVLTVSEIDPRQAEATVAALLRDAVPRGAKYVGAPVIKVVRVTLGRPADAILGLAHAQADLIVAARIRSLGCRGGCSVLPVPQSWRRPAAQRSGAAWGPEHRDAWHRHSHPAPGTILAAVDLAEHNQRQLALASELAVLARQPLVLMTVAGAGTTDQQAEQDLRKRAQNVGRREWIGSSSGGASWPMRSITPPLPNTRGLVVMGLRAREHGLPGKIASAVLKAKDALVLAVPAS